jgi:hypothetical protein
MSSTAPASMSSAAVSCSPWAAHSKPFRTSTTRQLDSSRPREALRPLNWFPSALHRLPDARRRLPPPSSSLLPLVAPNPKLVFPIDCTNTFPTTHWSSCAGPSPTSAAGASPSSLTPPPPLQAPVKIPLPGRRYPRHVVQLDHRKPLKLPLPSDLAAGGPPRRNRPVKPLPSPLTTARDHGLEDSKAQGAICKAKTHRNSARRTPLCYFYCRF